MLTRRLGRLACLIALASLAAADAPTSQPASTHWTFAESEGWKAQSVASLKERGWLVSAAADSDKSLFVSFDKFNNVTQHVELWDHIDSKKAGGDNASGTPTATLPFAPATKGSLRLVVATEGEQAQRAVIRLADREGRPLAQVDLTNNATGRFASGGEEIEFTDTASWWRSGRAVTLAWQVDADGGHGKVTFTFTPAGDGLQTVKVADQPFAAAGVPAQVQFQVGWGTATNKGLIIDELDLKLDTAGR